MYKITGGKENELDCWAKVHERRNTNAVRCKEGKWWESVTQCTHEGNVLERERGEGGRGGGERRKCE